MADASSVAHRPTRQRLPVVCWEREAILIASAFLAFAVAVLVEEQVGLSVVRKRVSAMIFFKGEDSIIIIGVAPVLGMSRPCLDKSGKATPFEAWTPAAARDGWGMFSGPLSEAPLRGRLAWTPLSRDWSTHPANHIGLWNEVTFVVHLDARDLDLQVEEFAKLGLSSPVCAAPMDPAKVRTLNDHWCGGKQSGKFGTVCLSHGANFFEEPLEVNTLAAAVCSQRITDGDKVMNKVSSALIICKALCYSIQRAEGLARRAFRKEHRRVVGEV